MTNTFLIRNTIIYTIGEVIPKLLSFILLPIYTHYLVPSDYGIITYTNSAMLFLFVLGSLSLNSYVLRFYFERKSENEKKKLIGNVFVFIGLINTVILVIGFIFIPRIIENFQIKVPWNPYFKLAFLINFLESFSIIPLVYYRITQNAKFFVLINIARSIVQCVLVFLFLVIFKNGLLGTYYSNLFTLLPLFIFNWYIVNKVSILNFDFIEIAEGLKFSLGLLPGALAYLLLSFFDRILLERFVPMSEVGIYNIAYTLAFALNMIIQSGYKAIEPEMFKRYNSIGFNQFILNTKSVFFFFVYCGAMFLTLFSQEIFKVMASPSYYKGYLLVPMIMVSVIMTGQNVIFGGILTAEKNTKSIGIATFLGVVISLSLNFLLIPIYGAFAAAFSSSISFAFINVILFLKMKFENKSLKQELVALIVFLVFSILVFYIFKLEISMSNILLKLAIFIIYLFLTIKIFNIKTDRIFNYFKKVFLVI